MASLSNLIQSVRLLGLGVVIKSLEFANYRDRWNRQRPSSPSVPMDIGDLAKTRHLDRGVEMTFQNAVLRVEFLADDLVKLCWSPGKESPNYAIARQTWPDVKVSTTPAGGRTILRTSALSLRLTDDGSVAFFDPTGTSLRQDDPPRRIGEGWSQESPLRPDEHIFGLGERAAGLNLRPGNYRFWNSDPAGEYGPGNDPLYMSIPVYAGLHSDGAYMIFYNNPHDGWLELGERAKIMFSAGELTTYFIAGPPSSSLPRFLDLTGRPPLPPRWALGLHQSRWGYNRQEDIRAVADGYRLHDLPLSAVHLDIDYMTDYRIFTIDSKRFPDVSRLASQLHSAGIRLVAILDPGIKQVSDDDDVYRGALEGGYLCTMPDGEPMRGLVWPGWAGFPDFTDPKARSWWGAQYQRLLDVGIDGFWHDMNEPTCFAAWGDTTFPDSTRHDLDGLGGDHATAHNLYALQMDRAGYEGLRSLRPGRRPFLLTRSGWAGVQRYAWHWTGDTVSSWQDLRMTIPSLLGLSLSGILFSGSDIGGFNGDPDAELYLRWFALSCLVPFCRVHSAITAPPREPWRYGTEVVDDVRRLLTFRQSIMPYLYTLAADAAERGHPWLRPVLWFDASDSELWPIEDAFGVGPDLLAAPLVQPGQLTREVRLPHGGWHDFWDRRRRMTGPAWITQATSQALPPLFVREGCILPTQEGDSLILTLYLPETGEAEGRLYSDPGDGYGVHRWDSFTATGEGGNWHLAWTTKGGFAFPYKDVQIRVASAAGLELAGLSIDGQTVQPGTPTPPFSQANITLTDQPANE